MSGDSIPKPQPQLLRGKEILLGTKSAWTTLLHENLVMPWTQNQFICSKDEAPCYFWWQEPHLQLKSRRRAPCCPGLFPREKISGTWDSSCPTELEVSKHSHSHRWPQTWQHLNAKGDLQNKVNITCYFVTCKCKMQKNFVLIFPKLRHEEEVTIHLFHSLTEWLCAWSY